MKSPIIKVSLGYGYSDGFFSRLGAVADAPKPGIHGGFDINTISGTTSGFKSRGD
jgi:hypothetical protein